MNDTTSITGKLEITIKINEFPTNVRTDNKGWKEFDIQTDGGAVTIKVKPKMFKKLEDAQANWVQWVAAIAGKMGYRTESGFELLEPNIQTFERKPKSSEKAEVAL